VGSAAPLTAGCAVSVCSEIDVMFSPFGGDYRVTTSIAQVAPERERILVKQVWSSAAWAITQAWPDSE
jgi:hypothetical protein